MSILYLGMADDVLTPFILYPDLKTLFVLDLYMPGWDGSNSLEESQNWVCKTIQDGNDRVSAMNLIKAKKAVWKLTTFPNNTKTTNFQIIRQDNEIFEITFDLNNISRRIKIYYQSYYNDWPEDICGISTVLGIQSITIDRIWFRKPRINTLFQMFRSRCKMCCRIVVLFTHKYKSISYEIKSNTIRYLGVPTHPCKDQTICKRMRAVRISELYNRVMQLPFHTGYYVVESEMYHRGTTYSYTGTSGKMKWRDLIRSGKLKNYIHVWEKIKTINGVNILFQTYIVYNEHKGRVKTSTELMI